MAKKYDYALVSGGFDPVHVGHLAMMKDANQIANEVIILLGVISGLVYFFFSKEHKGLVGKVSRIGVYFLMIKFGASFGFAVMGRISLLIGRFEELIEYSSLKYYYSTPIILVKGESCLNTLNAPEIRPPPPIGTNK